MYKEAGIIESGLASIYENEKDLIFDLTDIAKAGKFVFRGYSQQEHMLPSIIRKEMVDIEFELLQAFERYASGLFNASNSIDFMSFGQHFGLPTRLLDFTYNPFVALYFALYESKDSNYTFEKDDDTYYYLTCASLAENIHCQEIPVNLSDTVVISDKNYKPPKEGYLLSSQAERLIYEIKYMFNNEQEGDSVDSIWEGIQQRKILFIDPNQSNQRITMQQGLFFFPYSMEKDKHKEIVENNTTTVKIHKDLRQELLKALDGLGINAFRIMPDLMSICGEIERLGKSGKLPPKRPSRKAEEIEPMTNEDIDMILNT